MTEVVSLKFKNRGKCYFFAPNGIELKSGDRAVVETSKGLELADCCRGNHLVEDSAVVQPLRAVVRKATADDLRVAEINKQREAEALVICRKKIEEHGLDMKLVDVECSFEGNKTTFFFTSSGRVDFRELVKDLAGIFRNRIELRQIGVRDETKMLGGIGMCGRPYCCSQFLEDFQPVSTKMAKVQSLSLNPTKISGACGRLMCCLRYEQEAYEDLVKKVPKQGAFVETIDGYGTAVQVNLLRQTVKVKLDSDTDDSLHLYKHNELAAVPGGRPKEGEPLPSVLHYVPEEPEELEPEKDEWDMPVVVIPEPAAEEERPEKPKSEGRGRRRRKKSGADREAKKPQEDKKPREDKKRDLPQTAVEGAEKPRRSGRRATVKPVRVEPKARAAENAAKKEQPRADAEKSSARKSHRRRYRGGGKSGSAE